MTYVVALQEGGGQLGDVARTFGVDWPHLGAQIVSFGIVWLVVLVLQVMKRGLIGANRRRMMCLSMFWHFLDVVWIGVFTFVYLMGVLP